MTTYQLDMRNYHQLARQAAAEGCVLLRNENQALPIIGPTRVSLFGRSAFHYYKSGTGSGGLVNTRYVVGILDAIKACPDILLNQELLSVYEEWLVSHPFNQGEGWGGEPWSQEEMPLGENLVQRASEASDMAIIILGRTAGEDQDAGNSEGSYLLNRLETDMLEKVCRHFSRTVVLLNVGSIIDMKWVERFHPSAVLYVWQGGQEGGNGVLDVLTGRINPCGHLTDTIARDIQDYPSTADFGDPSRNIYREDIYVGYRYFETFAPEKVLYPFGYGLSYTQFSMTAGSVSDDGDTLSLDIAVSNTGRYSGKQTVQLYVGKPQGKLGKPVRELIAFDKTGELAPGQTETLRFRISKAACASYDDSGCTGYKSCMVLEPGTYTLFFGSDVRSLTEAAAFTVDETLVTEELKEALAPVIPYGRLKPSAAEGGFVPVYEDTPLRAIDLPERIRAGRPDALPYTGDLGYRLSDVYDGKIELETFLAQLSDNDLMCLVRGEGMSSPKVTPGTAAAFGGVTPSLAGFGIPIGCCSDGPSGIRMDCGTQATSLPNGTSLGCTFNRKLIRELYTMTGFELRKNNIDTLLGPGMNIHRNPLNGRNFEYISEDPYVTGAIASAQVQGLGEAGVTGTIKHFAANNQEYLRKENDSVVSERALREIYLKGFEIAVKEGHAYSLMTSYNAINGIWAAGNYDLVTEILRNQWGYTGVVMSDWWASMNEDGGQPSTRHTGVMVRAQNDLYMVVTDSASNSLRDLSAEELADGTVTRAEFIRCAGNICRMLMRSPVMDRYLGRPHPISYVVLNEEGEETQEAVTNIDYYDVEDSLTLDLSSACTDTGHELTFGIKVKDDGQYNLALRLSGDSQNDLAQLSVSVFFDRELKDTITVNGTGSEIISRRIPLNISAHKHHYIKLHFSVGGIKIPLLELRRI